MPVSSSGDVGSNPAPASILEVFLTRLPFRCLVIILIASLCFAVFTLGASAADSTPSVSADFSYFIDSPAGGFLSLTLNLGEKHSRSVYSFLSGLTVSFSVPGSLAITIYGAGGSTVSGDGVSYTVSGSALIVSVVSSQAGDVPITVTTGSSKRATPQVGLNSWIPGSGGESGGGDSPSSPEWTLGDNFGDWRPGLAVPNQTSTSTQWQTYNQYIGEYVTTVSSSGDSKSFSGPADSFFVSALAALSYDDWSWGVGEDGKMYFSPPAFAEGSWLDNMWRMDVYLYYNLANQTGWFGGVNNRLDTLNARVLQILSVLANDEDVAIKDATTDHRNWITDFFQGDNTGKPTTSDNDAVKNSINTVKEQFQTSYTVGDIGSIFSGNSYDNNIWYTFWSQSVFNDVNGLSRGGFGGSSTYSLSPDRSLSSWSSQYSYDDDTIPDMAGFGGGLSD